MPIGRFMQKLSRKGIVCAVAASITVACFSEAHSTTLVPTNIAQLSEIAESAFVIKVQSVETSVTDGGRAFEVVQGEVVEPFFGDVQTSQIISWNQFKLGRNVALPGMPTYQAGKEYVVFLAGKGPGTGFQSPVGLGQGSFAVTRNPQTGAAMVRNEYMNSSLSAGLNVDAAAREMVSRDARTRSLAGPEREKEIQKARLELQGRPGKSLQSLKRAAQFFHELKKAGRRPSVDFKTTAPARVVR